MSETTMALGDRDLERIGTDVTGNVYGSFVKMAPHLTGPQFLEHIASIEHALEDHRA